MTFFINYPDQFASVFFIFKKRIKAGKINTFLTDSDLAIKWAKSFSKKHGMKKYELIKKTKRYNGNNYEVNEERIVIGSEK